MRFLLERGPALEALENIEASGQHVETLATRPDANLPPELLFLFRQFVRLSDHRPAGMGVSAIPFTEIEAHWRIYLKDEEIMPLDEFSDFMTMLDGIYLEHHRAKADERRSKEKPPAR
jgi:hypothetical protein